MPEITARTRAALIAGVRGAPAEGPQSAPSPRRLPPLRQLGGALRAAGPALLGYALVRLSGLAILLLLAALHGKDGVHRLSGRWDSVWYQHIAQHGYGYEVRLPDGTVHSDLAFFPLFPSLERLLATVVPRLDVAAAGVAVSWLASLAAAWGIFAVGARLHGRRAGIWLAVLWGVYPAAFVQSMAYTETLFTALAAWSLYAVLTERWLAAGMLCCAAGLTRPSAVALVAAIALTAAWRLAAGGWHWRLVAAVPLGLSGWLSYVVFVAVQKRDPFAYFDVQAGWNNRIDGGVALARFVWSLLTGPGLLGGVGLCAVLALLGWMVVLCVRQRQPLPVLIYSVAVVVISLIGSGYFGSRPRLIMPAFSLLLPPAVALAKWRTSRSVLLLGALAVASGVYGALTLLGSGPP